MARLYCRVVGPVLLLVGVLGVVQFGIPGFPSINEPTEIAVHFITGALATYAGYMRLRACGGALRQGVRDRLPDTVCRLLHPQPAPRAHPLRPGLQPGAPGPRALGNLRRLLRAGGHDRPGRLATLVGRDG
jgi:hypothetical protein